MKEIQVGLDERSYPIMIQAGLLAGIGEDLRQRSLVDSYVVIADQHVADLYGEALLSSLAGSGLAAELLTFPRGEASKNLAIITDLARSLARLGLDRKSCLVGLGGGVTGDITGFLAAIYMRGISFVQVPTTLLAQVDSSVGGKTGVDIPEGKNLVGCFYQPRCVYIDSELLSSLPVDELLNGLAEVIKYGVIYDADFFDFLDRKRQAVLALDLSVIEEVIEKCCRIKADVVSRDEKEADLRRILNFGHTIGHAVEAASNYKLAHGMAVAIGMVAASGIALRKKIFADNEDKKVLELIRSYGLPVTVPAELDRTRIKEYLKTDKKAVAGKPFFVLPERIGSVVITDDVPEEFIDEVLDAG
ncbi:MAG: 3-dehydroquinate synthase [Desulfobulbaceae bacterium]|nr:3-dehydroquinate synthase [Desulfobulbaceae bacterium]